MTPRRLPGARLSAVLAVAWVLFWGGVAWSEWSGASDARDLLRHGRQVTGVVLDVVDGGETKLMYCRQTLLVSPRTGSDDLTVGVTRPCTEPVRPGDLLDVVVDRRDPARAVAAEEVLSAPATHGLPIVVALMTAGLAGYPLGRLVAARRAARPD